MMLAPDRPLVVRLEPGDGFFVDQAAHIFHFRTAAGRARTITDTFDFDLTAHEAEMEFRVGSFLGNGPRIVIEDGELAFKKGHYLASSLGLFRRFCAALASPIWNPLGYTPHVISHHADFKKAILAGKDGSPLLDDPTPELPPEMMVKVAADRSDLGSHGGLRAGSYQARLTEGGSDILVRLDALDDTVAKVEKVFVPAAEFVRAISNRDIDIESSTPWEPLPLWRYVVD